MFLGLGPEQFTFLDLLSILQRVDSCWIVVLGYSYTGQLLSLEADTQTVNTSKLGPPGGSSMDRS